jgi:hypothetical protein
MTPAQSLAFFNRDQSLARMEACRKQPASHAVSR